MIKDLEVKIWKNTRMVDLPISFIGNDMENLQKKIVFVFQDEFVNGQARLEYEIDGEKAFIPLTKENEIYTLPIKNILTKEGNINMQLVIDEPEVEGETPTFKSNIFFLYCGKSINAVGEAPDGYKIWIQQANDKLNEMDNFNISANKIDNVATVSITDRFGETSEVEIYDGLNGSPGKDGIDGIDGKDAKINGVNTINIEAGENIVLNQEGNTLTINSTATGGTENYSELINKPKINNVELNGNKTSSDLGLQPAGNYLTSETDPVFTASASAGISSSDITNWNSKGTYSKPSGGIPSTDLSNAVQTSLSKADTALQMEIYTGTITSVKMNGSTIASSGEADLGTVITQHQDITGKLDKSAVKTTTNTIQGNVYDVTYINTMLGNIESLLSEV